ncbi:osteocrin isoform X2 [Oryzias latipes]
MKAERRRRRSWSTLKMRLCCPLLVTSLLSVSLLCSPVGGFRTHEGPVQRRLQVRPPGAEPTAHLVKMEDDMKPKRKRSIPANDSVLDGVGVRLMEAQQRTSRQRKGAGFAQQRVKVPPIDRIGINRLPNRMGHASSKQRKTRPLS